MAQSVVLYRGSTAFTLSSNRFSGTLFTLPASGFTAAKLVFSRLLLQGSASITQSTTQGISLVLSGSWGSVPIAFASISSDQFTNVIAFAPTEGLSGFQTVASTGTTASSSTVYRVGGNHNFDTAANLTNGFQTANSSPCAIPKNVWATPGDSIVISFDGGANSGTVNVDYLFTAIREG